jgi:alanine-glyoxylate transaminase / serine-glyoxylate transaminase / serine-pyruvate transaminase
MLMIPGPSEPDPDALAVLSMPIMAHYGTKWRNFYYGTLSKLSKIFKTRNEILLIPTPGQVVLEMAAENLVKKGDEAFVCSNGYFGEMLGEIVRSHGARPVLIKSKLGSAVTLELVREFLEGREVSGKCIFMVHNETSTGVENPVGEVLKYCKQQKGMLTVADCISSFGGMDVRVDDWKADVCVGYASKALGGVFGVIPVSIGEDAWSEARKNNREINGRFLNLNEWALYKRKWNRIGHPYPSSMPTSIIAALDKAVDIALEEGLEKRYARHKRVAALTREGLENIGLEIFPDKSHISSTVSVAKIDPVHDKLVRETLSKKYDIMIGGGIEELEGKILRIGHMGTTASEAKVSIVLDAMKAILEEKTAKPKNALHSKK